MGEVLLLGIAMGILGYFLSQLLYLLFYYLEDRWWEVKRYLVNRKIEQRDRQHQQLISDLKKGKRHL